ncbi:hypothetical protein [Phycicoccus ginsengisoli]
MGAVAALLAVGAGGWFAFLSPHDSTIKMTADTSAAAPGKPVTVAGSVTPAVAHRVVELAVATTDGGPFTQAGTATTDASGHFETAWTPARAGKVWVKATAIELGRDQEAQSAAAAVTIRTPATVTIKLSDSVIRTTDSATVTAAVVPAGGALALEKSADGSTWTSLGAVPGSAGSTSAKLSGLTGGTWHLRATAAQTDTATAATSKDATLAVEDYKAAGAKYLAIVANPNDAIGKLNDLLDAGAPLSTVKNQAAVISAGMTQEAEDFRAYTAWPRAVAPVIEQLAKDSVVDADHYHLMSQAHTIEEWNQQAADANANADVEGAAAARARDLLGLPKRNLHP